MADVGVLYTLVTPGPDITFNSGTVPFDGTDKYYITEISGLAMPAIRTPIDSVPLGDGLLLHDFWEGGWHLGIEGTILVNSTRIMDNIVVIRNNMEADLRAACRSLLTATGTFSFTPQGEATESYTVKCEVPLDFTHESNYLQLNFSFGLVASA